jgi:hypothetical protein
MAYPCVVDIHHHVLKSTTSVRDRGARRVKTGWLFWFVWFVSFICLNKTNQRNQMNQTNRSLLVSASPNCLWV